MYTYNYKERCFLTSILINYVASVGLYFYSQFKLRSCRANSAELYLVFFSTQTGPYCYLCKERGGGWRERGVELGKGGKREMLRERERERERERDREREREKEGGARHGNLREREVETREGRRGDLLGWIFKLQYLRVSFIKEQQNEFGREV